MTKTFLSLIFSVAAFGPLASGQVYAVNVTAAGTGFSTAPIVTASGGGCGSEPTFAATVSAGALASVNPTFAGSGCSSPPTLAVGGPGTGAAATAVLLPATITVLAAVPSQGGAGVNPTVGGTDLAWQFACWLTVPASRVQFYSPTGSFRFPGSSQATALTSPPAGIPAALASGIIAELVDYTVLSSTVSIATVEAAIVATCAADQTALTAWNPWVHYGSTYLGGTWTGVTIP